MTPDAAADGVSADDCLGPQEEQFLLAKRVVHHMGGPRCLSRGPLKLQFLHLAMVAHLLLPTAENSAPPLDDSTLRLQGGPGVIDAPHVPEVGSPVAATHRPGFPRAATRTPARLDPT